MHCPVEEPLAGCAESSPYPPPPHPFLVLAQQPWLLSTGPWDSWLQDGFPSQYSTLVALHTAQTISSFSIAIPREVFGSSPNSSEARALFKYRKKLPFCPEFVRGVFGAGSSGMTGLPVYLVEGTGVAHT